MRPAPSGIGKEAHAAAEIARVHGVKPYDQVTQMKQVRRENPGEFETRTSDRMIQSMQ
jgi:hypothetical protein